MNADKLNSPRVWAKVARLFLRTIPLVPGPEIFDLLVEVQRSQGELGQKVAGAAASLEQASKLVEELESELGAKLRQVEKLQTEYDRYEKLAAVEEGKAKAMIDELHAALGTGRARERWIALGINLLAGVVVFVLGVVLSPWVRVVLGVGG